MGNWTIQPVFWLLLSDPQPTMLTYTSNPLNVPTISLSPFMMTQILEPIHLSISSDGRRCEGLFWSVFPLGWIMVRRCAAPEVRAKEARRLRYKRDGSERQSDRRVLGFLPPWANHAQVCFPNHHQFNIYNHRFDPRYGGRHASYRVGSSVRVSLLARLKRVSKGLKRAHLTLAYTLSS